MVPHLLERVPGRWQWLWLCVGAAALLFFAYGQALTHGPFGINDDYQYLLRTYEKTFDPAHNELMGMGRPLNAWGVEFLFGLCDGQVARMVWLRAGSVLGIGLFAWTLFRTLAGSRYSRGFALTVAASVLLLPACGVYAAYACAVFIPYTLVAALWAGQWLIGRADWKYELAAGGLIVAACATWQAAAPLAMFPALVEAWRRAGSDDPVGERSAKAWWRPWLIGGLAVAAYGVTCVLVARFGALTAGVSRLAVATDWRIKGRFLADILRTGTTSWARLQAGGWEWTVGTLTVGACLASLVVWRDGRLGWVAMGRRLGLAVAMVLLSVAPLLVAKEDNGAFRTVVCLYVVVVFLALDGARQILRRCPAGLQTILALGLIAAAAGAARYHVWHGLVEPSVREYVGLRTQVRRQFPAGPPAHLVYLAPFNTLLAENRLTPSWEYGLVSSTFWWVTRPFLTLIFAEDSPQAAAKTEGMIISYREAGNPGVPVLDAMPVLLREAGEWRDDPYWGRVRAFRNGCLYSPWLGYLEVATFPTVQHSLLGTLICAPAAAGAIDLSFYHEGIGRFRTNPQEYPRIYLEGSGRWVTVSDDNPAQIYLSDNLTGERLPYAPW